jgi:hypothetical protein
MTTALASAADARYGYWLLNLLGSVEANSDIFDRIVVYDLGLNDLQRRLLAGARGVELGTVPEFAPHWRQGRSWKTWIWAHLDADEIVWLDAGITVLRPLTEFLEQIRERGYFVVSQGVPSRETIPSDYYAQYDVPETLGDGVSVAAGILGFKKPSSFYEQVILPSYADALAGRSLGFSSAEVDMLNHGLDRLEPPILRDCRIFRHEQTLLTIHFYRSFRDPFVNDLSKFGGWKSPNDHPEQVIWSHRRRGDFRYLPAVRYRPGTLVLGKAWGVWFRSRWWVLNHRWLLRPQLYVGAARRAAGTLRATRR